MAFQNNLLVRLHKWAARQDENFLTETFVHLLVHLSENERESAARIVSKVTGQIISLTQEQMHLLELGTQTSGEDGITDIELRTPHHFVIIEVKSGSSAGEDQLRRYREKLTKSKAGSNNLATGLFMLTRNPVSIPRYPEHEFGADGYFRWYDVAEWIEGELGTPQFKVESQFLVQQFLGFLQARRMTMEKVTWHYLDGVSSFHSLLAMIEEAATALKLEPDFVMGRSRDFVGFYLCNKRFWIGILFSRPNEIRFNTQVNFRIASEKIEPLGVGESVKAKWHPDGLTWERFKALDSEEIHFFSRSKAGQMQWLESFLKESVALANQIEKPSVPPATA